MIGLYDKYEIKKKDGSEVDPEAVYFVLRLDKDGSARLAALVYATSIEEENPVLASDLKLTLNGLELAEAERRIEDAQKGVHR